MIEWIAEKFERICSITVVMNFILCGGVGAFIGYNLEGIGLCFLFLIIGVGGAFFLNVLCFGFIAQFIKISTNLEELYVVTADIEGMLENTNFDEEITNIKVIVKNIEEKIQ